MSNLETTTLHQIQCQMGQAIMRPLVNEGMQKQWLTGANMQDVAAQFIKPNKDLSSFERLEIYNKQYWFRLLDSLQEDFPGLNTVLGDQCFEELCVAYLVAYPSRSYTLNHLGAQLAKFIQEEPEIVHPHSQLAYEVACMEWAEIVAFDAQEKSSLSHHSLQNVYAEALVLQLQPHITILELNYALDNFLLQLNKGTDKSVESNAISIRTSKTIKVLRPKRQHMFMAVHRLDNAVYYKRLNSDQYFLLKALSEGKTLAQSCRDLLSEKRSSEVTILAQKLNQYFTAWMELNWFCIGNEALDLM